MTDETIPAAPPVIGLNEPEKKRGRPRLSDDERAARDASKKPRVTVPGDDKPKPRRTTRAQKIEYTPEQIGALAKQVQGLHLLGAMATGIPEIAIKPDEAEMLAQGMTAVAQEYDLAIDGKTGAAVQLFAAAAMVYAPHFLSYKARIGQERAARIAKQRDDEMRSDKERVTPIRPDMQMGGIVESDIDVLN